MLKLLRSYFFWTYERGSLHYDVMVTLILVFIFFSPHFINYKDQPVPVATHANDLIVRPLGTSGNAQEFLYQIRGGQLVDTSSDAATRASLLQIVQPIAGEVQLKRYQVVRDDRGKVISYDVWVLR